MDRAIHLIISITLFMIAGFMYLLFELFAPYCSKHVCCSSSGGVWSLVPALCIIIVLFGVLEFVENVLLDKELKK
jgi:hypothetical protein